MTGFAIQLASVKQLKSLNKVLSNLAGIRELKVLEGEGWWFIIQGQYTSRVEADAAASKLSKRYQLGTPWVRPWSELKGYELYQP